MLFRLAWRNIWRNKRRSIIVILSVIVGIVAVILYDSLSVGMIVQMLDNQIGAHVSHLQIHKQGFNDNKIIQNYIPHPARVEAALREQPGIRYFSRRVITQGLISSASSSSGVMLVGIHPQAEEKVTKIKRSLVAGEYLSGSSHEIVIGRQLAEKLEVDIGDKVVVFASALDGQVGSELFRITGLYQTFSSQFDKIYIYVPIADAQRMLSLGDNSSEFAVIVESRRKLADIKADLAAQLGEEYEIFSFRDLLPLLVMQVDVYKEFIYIFYLIIAVAMIFGIINTMLVSIFERINEFGVLMAVGMKNGRLFSMILLEAFYLGAIGTLVGFGLGYLFYLPLSNSGIDLSAFAESLNSIGSGTIIYPVLTVEGILNALFIIPFIAVLGAVYPAIKAIRFQPVEAIRYV